LSRTGEDWPQAVVDFGRGARIGLEEAVYCANKQAAQIEGVLAQHAARRHPCLLTRLSPQQLAALGDGWRAQLDYDPVSRTAFFLEGRALGAAPQVAVVSGGSSDATICGEVARTLAFHGVASTRVEDVGVAGLWRLMDRLDEIRRHPVVIAVAGMEGALFSVLGGLVGGVVIAVPSSVGYGVAAAGDLSLRSALASCAPGIVVVNIDNGYGAACAALRVLGLGGATADAAPAPVVPQNDPQ
jgi:pyridinium-3,5-biscarboxylic acid mononucleotide synthase